MNSYSHGDEYVLSFKKLTQNSRSSERSFLNSLEYQGSVFNLIYSSNRDMGEIIAKIKQKINAYSFQNKLPNAIKRIWTEA